MVIKTRIKKVKVNTHSAWEGFDFSWEDRSPPASSLHFLSVLLLTRLKTYKYVEYSPKASSNYDKQYARFIRENNMDTHYNKSSYERINSSQADENLVYNAAEGERPWYTYGCAIFMMDLLLIGWIARFKLNKNTKIVDYYLLKYIKH